MVKLKSHKIKHTPLCDLLSVLVKHWFPVFHHRIFKSKHLPVAFYLKVKVVVQICLDCPVHFMQFLFALTQYHHVIHVSHRLHLIKRSDMRRNWTHRCSSSHCPQNCSNSSNPHRNNRHCYSYRRQGRPQGAGTPPDTAPYIPIFIFLKTTTPPNGGNSGGVPPPFLPLLLTQR